MSTNTFDPCAVPAGTKRTCDGQEAFAYRITPPPAPLTNEPAPSRIEWLCPDCAFDLTQIGYDVERQNEEV